MKNFVLKEMRLLSLIERRAKRIEFDRNVTIVFGANDTGKSSLLKTLYRTFGAEPAKVDALWERAEAISCVTFSVNDSELTILRARKGLFALFDDNLNLLQVFTSVTNELGPFLAELFDFRIKLLDANGNSITPPPAFLFLPYYVDQDRGWLESWSSFANLSQFTSWRQNLCEYHTGIKPNSFYETNAEVELIKKEVESLQSEVKILESAKERIKTELTRDTFSIDLELFKEQLDELLTQCDRLNVLEEEYKVRINELRNERTIIAFQIGAAEGALRESQLDYAFAVNKLKEDVVHCPTCDAVYENSFAERFAIAEDEGRARELLVQLRSDEASVKDKIKKLDSQFTNNRLEIVRLNEILDTRKQEIRLRDVIESEGKREVDKAFENHLTEYKEKLGRSLESLQRKQQELKALEKELKARKTEIVKYYRDRMTSYLHALDVLTLQEETYKHVHSKISATGSDLPRALLAYYFSILSTIKQFSPTTYCPIVIDSPNQQAQDRDSLKKMIAFIFNYLPEGSQLVLGLEDLVGIDPPGPVLELTAKLGLLSRDEYAENAAVIEPLLDLAYQANAS